MRRRSYVDGHVPVVVEHLLLNAGPADGVLIAEITVDDELELERE